MELQFAQNYGEPSVKVNLGAYITPGKCEAAVLKLEYDCREGVWYMASREQLEKDKEVEALRKMAKI